MEVRHRYRIESIRVWFFWTKFVVFKNDIPFFLADSMSEANRYIQTDVCKFKFRMQQLERSKRIRNQTNIKERLKAKHRTPLWMWR